MFGEFMYPDPTAGAWMLHCFWARLVADDKAWLSPFRRGEVAELYFESLRPAEQAWGFNLKIEYLEFEPTFSGPIYELTERVVLLKRRNLLHQIVSYDLMRKRLAMGDKEVHRESVPALETVTLDTNALLARLRRQEALIAKYERLVRHKPVHVVYYEDITNAGSEEVLIDIQDFLGVKPMKLPSQDKTRSRFQY